MYSNFIITLITNIFILNYLKPSLVIVKKGHIAVYELFQNNVNLFLSFLLFYNYWIWIHYLKGSVRFFTSYCTGSTVLLLSV